MATTCPVRSASFSTFTNDRVVQVTRVGVDSTTSSSGNRHDLADEKLPVCLPVPRIHAGFGNAAQKVCHTLAPVVVQEVRLKRFYLVGMQGEAVDGHAAILNRVLDTLQHRPDAIRARAPVIAVPRPALPTPPIEVKRLVRCLRIFVAVRQFHTHGKR